MVKIMHLTWDIPVNITVLRDILRDNEFSCSYDYKDRINVSFFLTDSEPIDTPYNDLMSQIKTIRIIATDIDANNPLIENLIINNKNEKLFKEIMTITNRIMFVFRNYGYMPKLREFTFKFYDFVTVVALWRIKKSRDLKECMPLIESDRLMLEYLAAVNTKRYPIPDESNLTIEFWNIILRAFKEDIPLPSEREFIVNAAEHMYSDNYRLAVVESIIGLEIVLNQFLRTYLSKFKGYSKGKIDKFLAPEFTLSIKLSGLLELTLQESSLDNIDMEKVRNVISWRNEIVHKTGKINSGISRDLIISSLTNVFSLSILLSTKITQIENMTEPSNTSRLFPLL